MFSKRLLELIGLLLLWGAMVYGAISLNELRFGSEYSICGPWAIYVVAPGNAYWLAGQANKLRTNAVFESSQLGLASNELKVARTTSTD